MDIIELSQGIVDIGFTGFLVILIFIGMREHKADRERYISHLEEYHVPKDKDAD